MILTDYNKFFHIYIYKTIKKLEIQQLFYFLRFKCIIYAPESKLESKKLAINLRNTIIAEKILISLKKNKK
jgi:hypothetical protein